MWMRSSTLQSEDIVCHPGEQSPSPASSWSSGQSLDISNPSHMGRSKISQQSLLIEPAIDYTCKWYGYLNWLYARFLIVIFVLLGILCWISNDYQMTKPLYFFLKCSCGVNSEHNLKGRFFLQVEVLCRFRSDGFTRKAWKQPKNRSFSNVHLRFAPKAKSLRFPPRVLFYNWSARLLELGLSWIRNWSAEF